MAAAACFKRPDPGAWQNGAGGTRTHDLRFRKPSLYPAELQPPIRPAYRPALGDMGGNASLTGLRGATVR